MCNNHRPRFRERRRCMCLIWTTDVNTRCHLPVAVHRSFEELHGILRLSEFAVGGFDLRADAAHAGVALEGVRPALGLLVHHLQHVSSTLLRGGQFLKQKHEFQLRCNWLNTIFISKCVKKAALFWLSAQLLRTKPSASVWQSRFHRSAGLQAYLSYLDNVLNVTTKTFGHLKAHFMSECRCIR